MELQDNKYLTFTMGKEEYGIPILKVKEIIGMMEITPVPKTPQYIKGVVNLRGKIIPIMDLRLKFGLEEKTYTERTCIIVIEVANTGKQMGVAVDAVSEVVNINKNDIEPPANYYEENEEDFLTGIGKVDNRVVMLLNTDRVLSYKGLTMLNKVTGELKGSDNNV